MSRILAGRRSVGYPLGARGFSLHLNAQNGFEAHPSFYSMSIDVLSLKIERPEHEAYQSFLFRAEVWGEWLRCVHRDNFAFLIVFITCKKGD